LGQSLSLALVQPDGQQASPLTQAVIGVFPHAAVQVPAFMSVDGLQGSVEIGQLVGHAPV
jgi:hypothetical protein